MIVSNKLHSRKKQKFFSRKKIMRGGQQIVAVNNLDTYVYINLNIDSATNMITINNITNSLVKFIATSTPGSVILSVDPSLSSLKDYTLFGYNGTSWAEIPRENLDMGGNSISLYGNVPGMLIRKQRSDIDTMASVEVSIPVPVNTYGNVMQFVNISTSDFPFTLQSSADTFSSNIYIQLIFSSAYPTANTKLSGWIPNYIPGLNLWLNASEPGNNTFTPNTGVKMLNWTDKSGKNNHATAEQATAPMYRGSGGGMGMYFNGSTFFSGNVSNTSKYSYTFIVARPDISNSTAGRLLSLSAPNTDDSTSDRYMGVSATSGIRPTTKIIVMGVKAGNGQVIKYGTTATNGILSWIDVNGAWSIGACSSIAYGMGLFVAVGNDTTNGTIRYSRDGMNWLPANMAAPGDNTSYGFFFNSGVNLGGINTVIFTGSIWICGGLNSTSYQPGSGSQNVFIPGLAYSYDGINWFKNTTTLPFTGTGACITSIATDGNLIILTGTLTPSMNYSYDGINWFNMPSGVKTATQVGDTENTGTHAVTYNPGFKIWLAGGDAGNTGGAPTNAQKTKIIAFSYDGFNWNLTQNSQATLTVPNYTAQTSITRIFSLIINNISQIVMSGRFLNSRASAGPIISTTDTSVYGFNLQGSCANFPTNGSNPAEVSAVYYDGTKVYYGLQNPSSNGSYLIHSQNINGDWTTIPAINTPVNVIIDNMGGDPSFRGNLHLNKKTTVNTSEDTDTMKPCIISSWDDGVNMCVAVNGSIIPSNQPNPAKFNISSYIIGKNSGTSYNNYSGYIYEIIAYNVLLYSRSRFAVEGYLAWKWGIQSLLPTSHMYYNSAPTPYSLTTAWPNYFIDLQPILWIDAQDPNANESFAPKDRTFIKTWYDKSGNNNHLTAPEYSEPIYTTNVIKQGGIQFNRYPFQSMSYIPAIQTLDNFSNVASTSSASNTTKIAVNQVSNWIPGFGAMGGAGKWWQTSYDDYDFLYIVATGDIPGCLYQYDENNNQIRVLYKNPIYEHFYSVYVSPINGYIYFTVTRWNPNPLLNSLVILVPNSFPTTANTTYPTARTPTLKYIDWNTNTSTDLIGFGSGFVIDKNGNMYLYYYTGGSAQSLYIFSYSSNFVDPNLNDFVSRLRIKQIGTFSITPFMFYSSKDNAITITQQSQDGRVIMYLDTMATFRGSVSGTTLTVESITSGKIVLGSLIDTDSPVKIMSQISGTAGDVGTYTLSASSTIPLRNILAVLIVPLITPTAAVPSATTFTLDGLLNLSVASDPLSITNNLNYPHYTTVTYDSITNSLFTTKDSSVDVRLKRINISSRQVVTMAGSVNNRSPGGDYTTAASGYAPPPQGIVVKHNITSEKFPIEYGITNHSNQVLYDLVANTRASIYMPLFIGKKYAYFPMNVTGDYLNQVVKLNNFRANPSCMFGSLPLTGSAVSIFIVYSNRNSSKNTMAHDPEWNTPIVSLSSTDDFCVFIGGIGVTNAPGGAPGTVLVITQIISGTLQVGATINTPLGGFISSEVSGTTFGNTGSYNVSIIQSVPPGTTIRASNGIGRVYSGGETNANGPNLGVDTTKSDFMSLYANNMTAKLYRNNPTVAPPTLTIPITRNVPASGIATRFIGSITTTTLTVTAVTSGVIEYGSVINIPGSSIKPIVIGFGTTNPATSGFNGTYTLDIPLSVPAGTMMTSNIKATRIVGSIASNTNVLQSTYSLNNAENVFGTLQVGATLTIVGYTVKPIITSVTSINADGTGTFILDTTFKVGFNNARIHVTNNTVIPDILLLSSTASSLSLRALSGNSPPAYTQQSATSPTFTPFKVTTIGLGLQPSNMSRIQSLLPNYFFDGTICEVIAYNTDLSTQFYKRQLLEGYLAWKWGAETKLPSSHLYKNFAPNTYVKTAIPCGPITVSNITDTTATISWPNNNISGVYFFYLNTASLASIVSNDANGPLPANSIIKTNIVNINSKSIILINLTKLTTYYLRVQSVGSESYVNTDFSPSFRTQIKRLAPFIINPNNKTATLVSPVDGPVASARVTNPSYMEFDAYDNLYVTWNGTTNITYPQTAIYNIRIITSTGNVYSIPNTAPNLAITGGNYSFNTNRIPIWVDKRNGDVYWSIYDTTVASTRIYRMTPSNYPLVESNGILNTTWTKLEIANITEPVTCMAYSTLTNTLWASSSNGQKYYKINITTSPASPPTIPVFGTVSQNYFWNSFFRIDGYDYFYVAQGTTYRFYWNGTNSTDHPTTRDVVNDATAYFTIVNNTAYFIATRDNATYSAWPITSGSTLNTPKILTKLLDPNLGGIDTQLVPGCADISDAVTILDLNSSSGVYSDQLSFSIAVDSKSNLYIASARYHSIYKVQTFAA